MKRWAKKDSYYYQLLQTRRWRMLRQQAMRENNGLCEQCLKAGVITAATDVHHVIPVERDRNRVLMEQRCFDRNNLICVCKECHASLHNLMASHTAAAIKQGTIEETRAMAEALLGEAVDRDKLSE